MLCKKCGKRLKKGEEFCNVCGYYNNPDEAGFSDSTEELGELDEEYDEDSNEFDDDEYEVVEEEEYDDDEISSNLINNTNIEDEKSESIEEYSLEAKTEKPKKLTNFKDDRFIEAYIGEDYKWIIKRPVNIYAMLLSWVYFLYRKMYIIGSLGLALTGVVYRLGAKYLPIYIALVMILSGILFNPIYRLVINFKIKRIKNKNYGTDDFTLEEICKKKGGVNTPVALLIFLIFLLIMLRTYYRISYNNENTKFWHENSENKANCNSMVKQDVNLLDESNIDGDIKEAVCHIRKTNTTKSYDIYLKIIINKKEKYVYFKDNKNTTIIEGLNGELEDLQQKNRNNTITEEEKKLLDRILDIKSSYSKYYNESKNEDTLIKTRKNFSEKINYIISKDEILR